MTAVMLLCLCAQTLLAPAQRTASRLHFHSNSAFPPAAWLEHGVPADDVPSAESVDVLGLGHDGADHDEHLDEGRTAHREFHHPAARTHAHSHLAAHDHDDEDKLAVVYVDDHSGKSLRDQGTATKRIALDVDGLWLTSPPLIAGKPAGAGFVVSAVSYRSHVELPPQRPPRAHG